MKLEIEYEPGIKNGQGEKLDDLCNHLYEIDQSGYLIPTCEITKRKCVGDKKHTYAIERCPVNGK